MGELKEAGCMSQFMKAGDPIWIAPYDKTWPEQFQRLAQPLKVIAQADEWAQQTGWFPGPSDA